MASIDLQIYVPGVAVVDISIDDSEDVSALLRVANVALRGRIKSKVLQLIPPRSARPLRPLLPLRRAGLRCGDLLTAQLKAVPEVVVTEKTFAAITPCGSVATWGALGAPGGNTSPVSDQLEKVIELTASRSALAALKADGSVVCWGAIKGGCSIVSELREVHRLFATHGAFAALTTDGTVRCWGDPFAGGDVAEAAKDLEAGGFEHIFATGSAFCALRSDSARGGAAPVVAWGEILQGGRAPEGLEAVRHIYATSGGAFAAIQEDGAVVTWGSSVDGGDSCRVQEELKRRGVRDIYSTDSAFAALTADGGLLAWGNARLGGVAPGEEALRRGGVRHLCSTAGAFAARCGDGTVLCWGLAEWGGSCRAICEDLKEVRFLHSTSRAFAAQRYDGRVLCWGDANSGGDVEE
ncbi:Putative E3 ubiquitin-protein ligase HERC2, partial [Durusdinium trenchii]